MNRGAVDVVVGGWHEGSVVVGGWHKGSSEPDHATREQLPTVVPPPGGRTTELIQNDYGVSKMRVQNDSKVNLYLQQSATHCLIEDRGSPAEEAELETDCCIKRRKIYCSRRRISGKSTDSGKCAPQL
eukprot:scaffold3464_cov268-Skeletonema_menzelii.AAC.2